VASPGAGSAVADPVEDDPPTPPDPAPTEPAPAGRAGRWLTAATWAVVAVGAALRVRQWLGGRPFWMDELLLLRAMGSQRVTEVLHPLELAQSAPPGWLVVQHAAVRVSGGDERVSRLLPLLLGVGAVALMVPLARLLLGAPAALAATAVVAVSPRLIQYSNEFKQYSGDVLWVELVLLVGLRLALGRGRPDRGRIALAVVGAAVVWWSNAGTLVMAAVLAALGLAALARRRWPELGWVALAGVPFLGCLAVDYAVLLRRTADNEQLQDYWSARVFPPDGPLTPAVALDWFGGRVAAVAADPVGAGQPVLLLVLVLAGLAVLARRRPAALPALLLGVAAVAAAGLLGLYPIVNRLALFAVPLVALAAAAPLDLPALVRRPPAARVAAAVLAVVALGGLVVLEAPLVRDAGRQWADPPRPEDARTVLAELARQRRPGDLVLTEDRRARVAVDFYGPRVGLGPVQLVGRVPDKTPCTEPRLGERLRAAGRYDRVWLVVVHTPIAEQSFYRAQLARFGPAGPTLSTPDAAAYQWTRAAAALPGPQPARFCVRTRPDTG
jgi:hypothetical protein